MPMGRCARGDSKKLCPDQRELFSSHKKSPSVFHIKMESVERQ